MSNEAAPAPFPPATLLVVDDNPVNLQLVVRTLDGSGHRILVARDGPSALAIARRARPDLILLDVMMPGQDGFDLCRTLKADPATEDAMIIFLSALGEVSDKVLGLNLGAVDYITKPIQAEEVLARVATHLGRRYLERELRRSRDRLDRELESAAHMQRLLLPGTLPRRAGVQFAAHYRTSRHAGGDYYDVLALKDQRLGVMVADVSGHGAPAAIVMAMLRATLHAHPGPTDPSQLFTHLNEHFAYLQGTGIFATVIYGSLDPASRRMRLACAGHPAPLVYRPRCGVSTVRVEAVMPLFLMPISDVPCVEHVFEPGDRLLLFTDGATDRRGPDGSMYDADRLAAAFARLGDSPPAALVQHIITELDTFGAGQEAEDDQTLLVVGFD